MHKTILASVAVFGLTGAALAETAVVTTTIDRSPSQQAADTAVGGATGAAIGTIVGGPVGALVGAAIGGAAVNIDPKPETRTYILENPAQDVILEGDVVVGAGVPETVEIVEVPDEPYRYARINGQDVLIDPDDRTIVHVYDADDQAQVITTTTEPSGDERAADTAVGGTAGAVAGALIAGPVGAVVGAAIGAGAANVDVDEETRTYIIENPASNVVLTGDVVVGAGVPETVTLHEVPGQGHRYARINGTDVLVDAETRAIIHVFE